MAGMICTTDGLIEREQATIVAECQLLLARLRSVRCAIIERIHKTDVAWLRSHDPRPAHKRPIRATAATEEGVVPAHKHTASKEIISLPQALGELLALDRFERRAISRRRRAIEKLGAIKYIS